MFCPSCGAENAGDARFCGGCGVAIAGQSAEAGLALAGESMTFSRSITTCFSKYSVWSGRASRAEYWWFYLFTMLLSWMATIVDSSAMDGVRVTSAIVNIALIAPSVAVMVRRLHDTNRSGWWFWVVCTIIGIPFFIYWLASKGDEAQNNYG